ncbi:hypothetical protein B9Y60_10590 [Stenotrophomonas maltophilia]|nr:hypothetical protein B9Y73_10590 [Stenotrophomonas maltophilia]PJL55123.1 hypothetical protein B9Y60_10590 [Stenotrophomonas maltophilia]
MIKPLKNSGSLKAMMPFTWKQDFNATLFHKYSITMEAAGITDSDLKRYETLSPEDAADSFAFSNDLERTSRGDRI